MDKNLNQSLPESSAGLEKYRHALTAIDGKARESTAQVEDLLKVRGKAGPAAAELTESFKSGPLVVFTAARPAMETYFDWLRQAREKHDEMLASRIQFNPFQHALPAPAGAVAN